ncbi:MAG TPA: murein biosynthesis integral membrane protein MurJ [Acetobacteraceae bacterium]|nr:murein biosynthesis integral membrane protein MurJ [Acetobacteraceae bacterium]
MLKGAFTVGAWTAASRVTGFARDMLIAALLGAGPVADAFFVASRLPNLFRRLFGEGAFNAAFVPVFSGLLTTEGEDVARGFAEEAAAVLAFWLLILTILGEIFMPSILHVIAAGFARDPAKFTLTVTLSRIAFPYLVLICLTALLSGVLNALDRFVAAAAAPLLYNAFSIAAMLALWHVLPTAGHALALGISASGVAQLGLLYWAVARAGMRLHLPRPRLTPRMRLLLRRMAPGLVGAGVTQLNLTMDTFIGSLLPAGSVSLLYYADRVNQLPLGILGTAVGTALLPLLSRQVSSGQDEAAFESQNRAIEMALVLTLPAAAALAILADPIMQVLFARGAFTHHAASLSAQSLAAYASGLPAFVLVKVLAPNFFARGDTSTPVKLGMLVLVLNFCLNLALMGPLKHVGPPLATSVAAWVNVSMLSVMLVRRRYMRPDRKLVGSLTRMVAAAALMAGALLGSRMALIAHSGHHVPVVVLATLVTVGLGVYATLAQVLGVLDISKFVAGGMRRLRRA